MYSPSDPSRIDEARRPSRSECRRIVWPSLSIPLQGTSWARIALYGKARPEGGEGNTVNTPNGGSAGSE